jgi:hypothetical protein
MAPDWSIRPESMSSAALMELYQLLKGSKDRRHAVKIQKELVRRSKAEGLTIQEIVEVLVAGIGQKRLRAAVAREWSEALGLTEEEAKRLTR